MSELRSGSEKSLAVIILSFNEEKNIAQALDSVVGWANEIIVVDSFSTDRTVEIAASYGCQIYQNRFESFSKQRNFAIEMIPIKSEWIFFLDADEWIPRELKLEIDDRLTQNPTENGFFIKWRFIWMGKWIRRGYYPTWILRLFRKGAGRCEERKVNEHFIVDGAVDYLLNDMIHEDQKGVGEWISKHNRYATFEALDLLEAEKHQDTEYTRAKPFGTQAERKRWIRYSIWNRIPLFSRPFVYFIYRYVIRGGILDGRAAFIYHFLQAFWYPMLIDIKYLELKESQNKQNLGGKRDSGV